MTERLTEHQARELAGEIHGGQSSALYAMASSGHVDVERLDRELRLAELEEEARETAQALREYINGVYTDISGMQ